MTDLSETTSESTTTTTTTTTTTRTTEYKSLHFVWFVSHGALTATSTLYFLSWLLVHPSHFLYRLSYLLAIVTYTITLYSAYKPSSNTNELMIKRMLLDEDFSYLFLAFYLFWTRRLTVTLVPFFVYSLFHVAQYLQSSLIPSMAPHLSYISDKLKNWIDQYHTQVIHLVAKYELFVVMGRLIFGLFVFRSSIFSILFYSHFLRMRYYTSISMRETLSEIGKQLDTFLLPPTAHPKVPPSVSKAYQTFRDISKIKKQQ